MKRKIVMLIMAGMLTVTSLAGCSSFKPEDVVATVEDQDGGCEFLCEICAGAV